MYAIDRLALDLLYTSLFHYLIDLGEEAVIQVVYKELRSMEGVCDKILMNLWLLCCACVLRCKQNVSYLITILYFCDQQMKIS